MADYHAYLANALFVGEEFVAHENGRTRALIRLHLDCLPVEIMQERAVVTGTFGDFKAQAVHTTHLFVRDAPADALSELEELSRNVAELLSFATVSDVVAFGYDFPAVNPPGERRAFSGVAQYFKPVIETHDGTAVREFLEKRTRPTKPRATPKSSTSRCAITCCATTRTCRRKRPSCCRSSSWNTSSIPSP